MSIMLRDVGCDGCFVRLGPDLGGNRLEGSSMRVQNPGWSVGVLVMILCLSLLPGCKQSPPVDKSKAESGQPAQAKLDSKAFLPECRKSCQAGKDSEAFQRFCSLYCDCSYKKLSVDVPAADMQAFTAGQKNASDTKIQGILQHCGKEAVAEVNAGR